jgi:diguanylate cyclase (GGDEF)-like protein/PAS domain S-box-containing protein
MAGLPEGPHADSVESWPWQAVCDQAIGPLALLDVQGRYCYVNPALCGLLGYDCSELLGRTTRDITPEDEPALDAKVLADAFAGEHNGTMLEKRYRCRDGSTIWVLLSGSVIRDAAGTPCFFLAQFQDITARRASESLWQRTFDNAPNGMVMLDLQGRFTSVNAAFCELLGYRRDELLGRGFNELTYPNDREQGAAAFADLAEGRREMLSVQKRYRHRDGHPLWVLIRSSAVPGPDGSPAFLVSQCEEIGNGRMADDDLAHLALHDPLTGLANRALLTDRLQHELAELKRNKGTLTVLVLDLNHLKPVNDRFGHAVGDELLTATAHQLLLAVRSDDTVARLGGDEFVVVSKVSNGWAAGRLRERIIEHLDIDIQAGEHRLKLCASVGFATTEDPTTGVQELLHQADRDMYVHKRHQRIPGNPRKHCCRSA